MQLADMITQAVSHAEKLRHTYLSHTPSEGLAPTHLVSRSMEKAILIPELEEGRRFLADAYHVSEGESGMVTVHSQKWTAPDSAISFHLDDIGRSPSDALAEIERNPDSYRYDGDRPNPVGYVIAYRDGEGKVTLTRHRHTLPRHPPRAFTTSVYRMSCDTAWFYVEGESGLYRISRRA